MWGRAFLDNAFAPAKSGRLTRRGKGSKVMLVVERQGLPLGVLVESAQKAEVRLAESIPLSAEADRVLHPFSMRAEDRPRLTRQGLSTPWPYCRGRYGPGDGAKRGHSPTWGLDLF
ncbi:hypothetical protein HRbin24_00128 [bacterium HR24]|nr:hypothetical protein HRbin24_00128 [bacterium HR24]